MIGFFPKLYPDELVYNWFARYYCRTGYAAYIDAVSDLFEKRNTRPDVEFINRLDAGAKEIITNIESMDKLVLNHTMFPYYFDTPSSILSAAIRAEPYHVSILWSVFECKAEKGSICFYVATGRSKEPLSFQFPQSCIVCVRPGIEKEEALKLQIVMPNGQKVLYGVPIVQAQSFSKEDMFKKKLLILIPFYVLRYEKDIRAGKKEILVKLKREYEYIKEQLIAEGNFINEPRLYYDLAVLSQKILDYVGKGNEDYKERMGNIMGGVILEMESDKIWDRAWNQSG